MHKNWKLVNYKLDQLQFLNCLLNQEYIADIYQICVANAIK